MIRKFFEWIFKVQFEELKKEKQRCINATKNYKTQERRINNLLGNIDVSVDVHQYASSWACISIQGKKSDFIKFINLGDRDVSEIQRFLHRFDRSKVDAAPQISGYLRHKNF